MITRLFARLFVVLALLIGLSGCTAVQLAYNNADTLIHWRAGQYFGFEGEQKAEFERRVQRFLAAHRKNEMPGYARMADEIADRLANGISQADLVWGYDSFQTQFRLGLRLGTMEVADLLDALTPEQLDRFQKRLDKENREHAKEYELEGTQADRRAARLKRNMKRLEEWFGPLTPQQMERLRLYNRRAPLDEVMRDLDRKRLQAELVAMLRAKEARQRLTQWAMAWDQHRDPAYESARKENQQEYYSMLIDLDKMLSSAQRERAVKRLRGFATDFAALAAAAGGAR